MLGWDVLVFRAGVETPRENAWKHAFARWSTGMSGLDWLRALVAEGKAEEVATNCGYPWQFRIPARHLLAALAEGQPHYRRPPVYGDNSSTPALWNGVVEFDAAQVAACQPDDLLDVEAWDQS